jgi:hypothetical protein
MGSQDYYGNQQQDRGYPQQQGYPQQGYPQQGYGQPQYGGPPPQQGGVSTGSPLAPARPDRNPLAD